MAEPEYRNGDTTSRSMLSKTLVEVSVNGRWRTVDAIEAAGETIVVTGRWIKTARVHNEPWIDHELERPEECVSALRAGSGTVADIFTFVQRPPVNSVRFGFHAEWESVAVVPLPSFSRWWDRLPQETRKNVRRAAKRGVVTRVETLTEQIARGIAEVNNDCPVRQGRRFDHYGKTLDEVLKDQATFVDRSEFICAYIDSELVGFLKVVYCGELGVTLQVSTKVSRKEDRPANALIARAIERCDEKGLSFFVYGNFRYGNQPNTSLMEFKSRNGFEEIWVPRYFVPLSTKGRLALSLGLHRDRVGILPQSVIAIGRRARGAWYKFLDPRRRSSTVEQPRL